MMAKVLSTCVTEDLIRWPKHVTPSKQPLRLLPQEDYLRLPPLCHHIFQECLEEEGDGQCLFLDIKGHSQCSIEPADTCHEDPGVPSQYTSWIAHKVAANGQHSSSHGYESKPLNHYKGIDQGHPMLGIAYHFTTQAW